MIRALVLALCLVASPAFADTTVYVVRHAEKMQIEGEKDPDLTKEGRARAEALADALRDVPITAIYTTQYKRNRQTVAPAEKRFEKKAVVVDAHDTEGLAKRIRASKDAAVLVAGHSNTVPEILTKLGVKHSITLDETDYDNLFVVRIDDAGAAHLVRLHFGVKTE